MASIVAVHARQILDSRGNPTVEVDVTLDDGTLGRAAVPSGASTGSHEALELRDDQKAYHGKGVLRAVEHINTMIAPWLIGTDANDQLDIDSRLVLHDGTPDLCNFGANAVLGVSLAVAHAAATAQHLPLYQHIAHLYKQLAPNEPLPKLQLPKPLFNILNGGLHTQWQTTDIQEFMIVPLAASSFAESLEWGDEVYHSLAEVLQKKNLSTMVGDEGGFAPAVHSNEEALELVLAAVQDAGYIPGEQIGIALDAATTELFKDGQYHSRVGQSDRSTAQMIRYWEKLLASYPIISLEDGLAEDDWQGWQELTQQLGKKIQIVGDDLLVTNLERIQKAIQLQACNTLLMKPNQIGTLTESLQAIHLAHSAGWKVIVSHRSGETEDTTIADLAVGAGCAQIKAGAPARGERLAKYNQLLRIEEELQ